MVKLVKRNLFGRYGSHYVYVALLFFCDLMLMLLRI